MKTLVIGLAAIVFCAFVAGCVSRFPFGELGEPSEKSLVTTGYCECRTCCSWERNWFGRPVYASGPKKGRAKVVGQTSSGSMARTGTIAADTTRYPYGTIMYIEGYGYGRVEDTGGKVKGDHIDLYFYSHRDALRWGRQLKVVKVWLPSGQVARGASRGAAAPQSAGQGI